jgi:hypothetical protein
LFSEKKNILSSYKPSNFCFSLFKHDNKKFLAGGGTNLSELVALWQIAH